MSSQATATYSLPRNFNFNTARTLTLHETQRWLDCNPYYFPQVDKRTGFLEYERSRLQHARNEEVRELYRGRMPSSCVADLENNRRDKISEYTKDWQWKEVSKHELEARIDRLNSWIDGKISDIMLSPALVAQARQHGHAFVKDMTSVATAMAAGRSDDAKSEFTSLLDSASRQAVHQFLMYDKKDNKSHFFSALIAHFVDPNDISCNPTKLIPIDERCSRDESRRDYGGGKSYDWIQERIKPETFSHGSSESARKAGRERERAVRFLMEAWTAPEDSKTGKRDIMRRLLRRGERVTYLPDASLTSTLSQTTEPTTSEQGGEGLAESGETFTTDLGRSDTADSTVVSRPDVHGAVTAARRASEAFGTEAVPVSLV